LPAQRGDAAQRVAVEPLPRPRAKARIVGFLARADRHRHVAALDQALGAREPVVVGHALGRPPHRRMVGQAGRRMARGDDDRPASPSSRARCAAASRSAGVIVVIVGRAVDLDAELAAEAPRERLDRLVAKLERGLGSSTTRVPGSDDASTPARSESTFGLWSSTW
jgi:hypothetical protein